MSVFLDRSGHQYIPILNFTTTMQVAYTREEHSVCITIEFASQSPTKSQKVPNWSK